MYSRILLTSKKNIQRTLYADGQDLIRKSEDKLQDDSQCTYNVTLRRVRVNKVSRGKAMSITCFECVCVCVCLCL